MATKPVTQKLVKHTIRKTLACNPGEISTESYLFDTIRPLTTLHMRERMRTKGTVNSRIIRTNHLISLLVRRTVSYDLRDPQQENCTRLQHTMQ